ncbi:radical SAM protein, partial [bacterium]|nr:radical SAM protein [bacterium]
TAMPVETLQDTKVNLVVTGEGEDAFTETATNWVLKSPQYGIVKGKGRINIDEYAFPARELADFTSYSRKLNGNPVVSLISSRGCPHQCIHCNSVVMGGGADKVRYRSPGNIISEIQMLRKKYSSFRFNDDNFMGNPGLKKLLLELKDCGITFRIFCRVDDLDEEKCRLLKEAGCVHISLGLESLTVDNLRFLGKKQQIAREGNIRIAKDCGLTVRASFMVGLPYDNDISIENSFRRAAGLGIDEFAIYPLIPYPGSPIWKQPGKYEYSIIDTDFTHYVQMGKNGRTCTALKHKNFEAHDVKRWLMQATQIMKDGGISHMSDSKIAT